MKKSDLLAEYKFEHQDFFTKNLLQWYHQRPKRHLPWKEGKEAYRIWLAEIMLQQTRVEQGLPYYEKFIDAFPKVEDLANAEEDKVMKLWQGLGYYARARNLHFTAKYIRDEYGGKFPEDYESIRTLKGVGDYTAAAIASFAFDLPHAVVDGNVYRVLARFFGLDLAIDSGKGKKVFGALAQKLLDEQQAADYNQAIMDFGALQCSPKGPDCQQCPLKEHCHAFAQDKVKELPFKAKKLKKKDRFFNYLVWQDAEGRTVLRKRSEKDIWEGLYDFPLIESDELIENWTLERLQQEEYWQRLWELDAVVPKIKVKSSLKSYKQTLSHQYIYASFTLIEAPIPIFFQKKSHYELVNQKNLENFALPKVLQKYFNNQQLNLFE
jgi:A/G-specific adenine glycosylase